jgi:hypothetical protein
VTGEIWAGLWRRSVISPYASRTSSPATAAAAVPAQAAAAWTSWSGSTSRACNRGIIRTGAERLDPKDSISASAARMRAFGRAGLRRDAGR